MADDKKKRGAADRARVSANERYEVATVAEKFDVPVAKAKAVIEKKGPMRASVERALKKGR